jgi:hypothetical protein
MKIPREITVGKKTYTVRFVKWLHGPPSIGRVYYDQNVIQIATQDCRGTPLGSEEIDDTFWHELTHCILHDMGHDLCDNERFVTAFANRLSTAVNSAKL